MIICIVFHSWPAIYEKKEKKRDGNTWDYVYPFPHLLAQDPGSPTVAMKAISLLPHLVY